MKCAIVMSSEMRTQRRWDAGYWLGHYEGLEIDRRIEVARQRVRMAIKRLRTVQAAKVAYQKRIQDMIDRGVVIPWDGTHPPPGSPPASKRPSTTSTTPVAAKPTESSKP